MSCGFARSFYAGTSGFKLEGARSGLYARLRAAAQYDNFALHGKRRR
jgi:hypothetical protein